MEVSRTPHYLLVDDHSLIREGMMQAIRGLDPAARFSQANSLQGTLSKLAETEGLDVTAEEIEEELDKLVEPLGDDGARFRDMFRTEEGVSTIRRNVISKKTLDRLAEIATASAPAAAVAAPKARKPRAAKPAAAGGASTEETS
jgi:hypothetical protein